jgi:hypothetical protein
VSLVGGRTATITSTFAPVADSFVTSAKPNTNYGSNSRLRAESSPVQRSYLRFNVHGVSGTIGRATLRLFATKGSTVGYEVRGTTNTTWGENTITYANAPPFLAVTGTSGANAPQLVIEAVDNTPPSVTLTSPANGSSTADTTPTFGGVGGTAAGDAATVTVKVYAGPTATGTPVRTLNAAVGAGGAYSVDGTPALDPGTYTAQAQQQDSAGNTGLSQASTFTVLDTVAPTVSLNSPAHGSTTADTTPSFTGIGGTAPRATPRP